MRILMKVIAAPIIAVLAIFTWLALQLVKVSAVVLNFIAIAVALGALYILWSGSVAQGIAGLVVALLLSPFGLPMFSIILLGQVQRFRFWIQDSVYG
ncbi:MAG: CD1845 family protein [Lachnospiraceae bacterium]|nr:CD1845 family protein [Lachnospiraceae bacterium]